MVVFAQKVITHMHHQVVLPHHVKQLSKLSLVLLYLVTLMSLKLTLPYCLLLHNNQSLLLFKLTKSDSNSIHLVSSLDAVVLILIMVYWLLDMVLIHHQDMITGKSITHGFNMG